MLDFEARELIAEMKKIFGLRGKKIFFNLRAVFRDERLGECRCADPEELVTISVRKDLPYWQAVHVLCHEIVHAHQFLDGRLVSREAAYWEFEGALVNEDEVAYRELPWEIEAWGRQDEYFKRFVNECPKYLLKKISVSHKTEAAK